MVRCGEPGVYALCVGVYGCACLWRQGFDRGFGQPVNAERAHEPVGSQAQRADDLRQPPGRCATGKIHLEEAVLRMDKAQRAIGVSRVVGEDVWNSVGVT